MHYYNKNYNYWGENAKVTSTPTTPNLNISLHQNFVEPKASLSQLDLVEENDYVFPLNLENAIELIKNAVLGEREDELFYDSLINLASNDEDKDIIMSIRDDEIKHNKMFRQLYYELTQSILPSDEEEVDFEAPNTYLEGIKKALMGELGAVERYRKILFALVDRKHINMLIEILTDELKHASKYNYLYPKGE